MEVAKKVMKHVVLIKFKDGIPPEKLEQLIKRFANLVNLTEPMKDFHWGTNVSIENLNDGFTHAFVSTFEGIEGFKEYFAHPDHVEFVNLFKPNIEKILVFDYKPTIVHL